MDYKEQEFQDFLNEHKALSQVELEAVNFPRKKFKKPQSPGVYAGRLVAKEWGLTMSLVSYFEIGEGVIDQVKFTTYRTAIGKYFPPKGTLALEDAEVGAVYTLYVGKNNGQSFLEQIKEGGVKQNLIRSMNQIF